ncbi:nucleoside-diphosphate sugar epimerase/dehydratase [Tessaracoccus sp. ZS01]|uniref:polysaccharide biosynthesis protein n=1 Tax=Tessaracoccus sp. ZS01 TaxID=1906324 RepID=UPI00096F3B29|nr:nucleoside-diphosphate sugar epimerase/dehydratase [Tessaracoccus sp. ZS01]MCG6568074.1 polysaccharide biosynthesis protein [Tessaracoccus sp. ZS01]OMG54153.1 dTDP-glucose 4,6-dehydratase [Tessaracoccus sp. ZS01]
MPAAVRRLVLLVWDALAWVLAVIVFLSMRNAALEPVQARWVLFYTAAAVLLQVIGGLSSQLYLGRNRIGSFADAASMGFTVAGIAVLNGTTFLLAADHFPLRAAVALPSLAMIFMATARLVFRSIVDSRPRSAAANAIPTLVYGAGNAGHQVATLMDLAEDAPYRIVGFVDDNRDKRNLRVRHHRVLGLGRDIIKVAKERGAQAVIFAISAASPDLIQRISTACEEHGLDLLIIPPLREMVGGQVTLGSLRQLNVADLLGRRPIKTDLSAIADYVTGKVVLVTGAGGSIGSELAAQVHRLGPAKLILLDRDESALHGVQLDLYGNGLLDTEDMVLCDIRDEDALERVFSKHRPDVVFHAAALKHLPMLERFPLEGWKTNVLGTRNVLRAAYSVGVERFVNISTDKAAAATSVLGRTKRLAERLTAWYATEYQVPYLSVRFGNVLGSRGSVLISFQSQIEKGGPVTVTHPDVTRYFMTIPEACELVMQAGAIGLPGDVLVLDMGEPVKILDVAKRMIAESKKDIEIHFTGLREGEKMHEVLFSTVEAGASSEHPLISEVQVPALDPKLIADQMGSEEDVMRILDTEPTQVHRAIAV